MQVEQSVSQTVTQHNCELPPHLDPPDSQYELFFDLETILLVLMIDFSNIGPGGMIQKEDLLAHAKVAGDLKSSSAARIAAEHFEELQYLLTTVPLTCCVGDSNQLDYYDDIVHDGPLPGLTLYDLLRALTLVSEHSPDFVKDFFPGLQFPCS
jgi:hypothetical protein